MPLTKSASRHPAHAMSRSFPPITPPPPPPSAHCELLSSLTRLTTINPPVQTCSTGWRHDGFYSGPTSIAFLFYRLSHLYPTLDFKSQSLLDWASAYLALGSHYLNSRNPGLDASHCGVANETLTQLALTCLLSCDASLGVKLCSYSTLINGEADGSNEWLYGRAGYLYLLRLLLKLFPNPSESLKSRLTAAISATIKRILECDFPWTWHGRAYLGAVHGSAGIIMQVLLSAEASLEASGSNEGVNLHVVATEVKPILVKILSSQFPSGNFPAKHTDHSQRHSHEEKDDRLLQFCHGSPGVICSLLSLRHFYSDDTSIHSTIEDAVTKAQPDILLRGLLTKTPCLCHGIPTNALALTSTQDCLAMLAHMSTGALEAQDSIGEKLGWMKEAGQSDVFAGLFTGEAGRAWTWAIVELLLQSGNFDSTADWNHPVDWMRSTRAIIGFNDL